MAEKFAASVNAAHIYTSAKMNEGIEELFVKLTTNILKKHAKPDAAPRFPSLNYLEVDYLFYIQYFLGKI